MAWTFLEDGHAGRERAVGDVRAVAALDVEAVGQDADPNARPGDVARGAGHIGLHRLVGTAADGIDRKLRGGGDVGHRKGDRALIGGIHGRGRRHRPQCGRAEEQDGSGVDPGHEVIEADSEIGT
jgi:hypothetical protein